MTQDIRLALRGILRAPAYALSVIGSLAIGIAAPALAFAIINALFLRPLPGLQDSDALLAIGMRDDRGAPRSTYDDYIAAKERLRDLVTLAAQAPASVALSRDDADAITVGGELVSGNYFATLGLRPVAGRFFVSDRDRPPLREPVVVLGYSTWRRHFQGDPRAVGRFVVVNGTPLQIVGVAPEGFHGVTGPENAIDLWLPVGLADLVLRREGRAVAVEDAGTVQFTYVGRLRPEVEIEQVQAAASTLGAEAAAAGTARPRVVVTSLSRRGRFSSWLDAGAVALAIMAMPLVVLAIACVNAGNLVLARVTRSSAAWSVQLALGATRMRLLRQPFVEGVLLALPAAAAGLLLTAWSVPFLQGMVPFDLVIDWRVIAFPMAIATATPLGFSIAPAWIVMSRTSGRRPGQGLQPSAASRARTAFAVAQIALSLALLGTGTQFVRTVRDGFGDGFTRTDATLVASFDVDKLAFSRDAADAFYATVLDRVRGVPGAAGATIVGGIGFVAGVPRQGRAAVWLPGDPPGQPRRTLIAYLSGDPFDILGLSLVSGRRFLPEEHRGAVRAVIVNEPFARQVLGGNPLGQIVRLAPTSDYLTAIDAVVVGVVGGAQPPRNDVNPTVFAPGGLTHLPVRTLYVPFPDAEILAAAVPAVREAFRGVDGRVPYTITTLQEWRATRSAPRRFTAVATAVLGVFALLLAAAGMYGVGSYVVELRRREIGVRMAVGASPSAVLAMVMREALRTAAIGSVSGMALATAVAVLLRSSLYGTAMLDPVAFGGAIAVLLTAMLLASALPAHRASRVDPSVALRSE